MRPTQLDLLQNIILFNNGNTLITAHEELAPLSLSALRYVLDAADDETIQGALDRSYVSEEGPEKDTEELSAEELQGYTEEFESALVRWRQRCGRIAQRMYNANFAIIEERERAEQARMEEEIRLSSVLEAADMAYQESLMTAEDLTNLDGELDFLRLFLSAEDFAQHPAQIAAMAVVEEARLEAAFANAEQAYQDYLWEQSAGAREEHANIAASNEARGIRCTAMWARATEISGREQSPQNHDMTYQEQMQFSGDEYHLYQDVIHRILQVEMGEPGEEFADDLGDLGDIGADNDSYHHWEWQRNLREEEERLERLEVLRQNLSPEDFEQHPLQLAAPSALARFDAWRMRDLRSYAQGGWGDGYERTFRQLYPNHHFRESLFNFHEPMGDRMRREALGMTSRLEFLIHIGCTKYLEDPVEAERLHELLLQEIEDVGQANFETERASYVEHYIFRQNGREIDEEVMEAHWRWRWLQHFGGEDEYNTRRAIHIANQQPE